MSTALYLALASSLASGLAASIAWWVKLRWADEYKLATEQSVKAKEAEIAALKTQVELLQSLHSSKLLEDAANTKSGLEKIIARVEQERDVALLEIETARATANREIDELRSKLAALAASKGPSDSIIVQTKHRILREKLSESEREERALYARELQLRAQVLAQQLMSARNELVRLEAQETEVSAIIHGETHRWEEEKQAAYAKMRRYQEQSEELRTQVAEIQKVGQEATCPTCGQVVGHVLPQLLEELQDQLTVLEQDAKWWSRRYEGLKVRPQRIIQLQDSLRSLQAKRTAGSRIVTELETRLRAENRAEPGNPD